VDLSSRHHVPRDAAHGGFTRPHFFEIKAHTV
jgi:hypothetical protein